MLRLEYTILVFCVTTSSLLAASIKEEPAQAVNNDDKLVRVARSGFGSSNQKSFHDGFDNNENLVNWNSVFSKRSPKPVSAFSKKFAKNLPGNDFGDNHDFVNWHTIYNKRFLKPMGGNDFGDNKDLVNWRTIYNKRFLKPTGGNDFGDNNDLVNWNSRYNKRFSKSYNDAFGNSNDLLNWKGIYNKKRLAKRQLESFHNSLGGVDNANNNLGYLQDWSSTFGRNYRSFDTYNHLPSATNTQNRFGGNDGMQNWQSFYRHARAMNTDKKSEQ